MASEKDKITTALLGIPYDQNSSYLQGAAQAPKRIREALFCESSNMWTETGLDLASHNGWEDLSDIRFLPEEDALALIEQNIKQHLSENKNILSLGGDHSITLPILRAYADRYSSLDILHLDAHPDLYDEFEGNRFSHACPFARIKEEYPELRLVQAGIRTATGHQREQAKRFGVELIEMKDLSQCYSLSFEHPVYLSLDLDCLDPAFAPGVSHHEPGGMTTREVINIIQTFSGKLVGADLVEFNPKRDINDITAMVAAKFLKEILGRLIT